MSNNYFTRELIPCQKDSRILLDPEIRGIEGYVESFGFEWTKIDGFVGKESMSHGHIFGRFLLPPDFFDCKLVVDVGCGNGRIGRLVAPHCHEYIGMDLSESVYAFPSYLDNKNITLVRASGTNLPVKAMLSDVTICWGVLHHMDNPKKGLEELLRVTKPGGTILIFIYSNSYHARKNLNQFSKHLDQEKSHELIESVSDYLDSWRDVDKFYADLISRNLFMSVKQSREWQIFQWFDGITPQFHWAFQDELEEYLNKERIENIKTQDGCYRIVKGNE
jgi:ubiquinone/menaquinone biosynthesis C-methylase UbiE